MRSFLILFITTFLFQINISAQGAPVNISKLEALKSELDLEYKQRSKRVKKYLKKIGKQKARDLTSQKETYIYDIVDGNPIVMSTYNEEAAVAIGADAFYEGGDLGIGLTGLGEEVGIWDGGIVRTTHQELKGRIMYFDSAPSTQLSDHSTSVAGTLLGSGLNDRARGMAYEAIGIAYDFSNDESEMVTAQMQRGLILSNHSYGPVRGWSDGSWQGEPNISDREDYRFGLYDGQARTWDRIAYDSPYYLMVKSAGNDRGDSGNGTYPSDGPFDCIAGSGLSKNVMTVGAIQKSSQGYDDPNNIRMSSFSGWGPTDDGRIKPDLSAVGVSIYSPHAADDEDYQFTQGTSFSAPSACGGLLLLQQLYKSQFNEYMRSATLKALAIQSIREAGLNDGPDYQFGWGILDAKAGAEVILARDNENVRIVEGVINEGEEFIIELEPKANTSLKATIAWTDLPGSPIGGVLDPTDLMLVNDLDMRVSDETGDGFMPWILNPAEPGLAATKGDNFRDNIEKIEVESLDPRKYFLTVTHKGELDGGSQAFSLILEYESEKSALTNLYWIGDQSTWSTGTNWSAQSGGFSENTTPLAANKLVFDNNSFSSDSPTVTIDRDYTIGSLVSFSDKEITFDLMGNTLTCTGSVLLSGAPVHFTNGTLLLTNSDVESETSLNFDNSTSENFNIVIGEENLGSWAIQNSTFSLTSIEVLSGKLSLVQSQVDLQEFYLGNEDTNANASFNMMNTSLNNISDFSIVGSATTYTDDLNSSISFNDSQRGVMSIGDQSINSSVSFTNSNVEILGANSSINSLQIVGSDLSIINDLIIGGLSIQEGSQLSLASGIQLDILSDRFQMDSGTSLVSADGANAEMFFEGHYAFCFDEVLIRNVDLAGNSSVSIGTGSNVTNSANWSAVECADLLFADYQVQGICADGLSVLDNTSNGSIQSTLWKVDGVDISDQLNATFSFPNAGFYDVTVVVTDSDGAISEWTDQVEIIENTLDSNYVVRNSTSLVSFKSAPSYQWFKNDVEIVDATSRTISYDGEKAFYFVVTSDGECNRKSATIDFTTSVINVDIEKESGLSFYPIPVQDLLNYTISLDQKSDKRIQITDLLGKIMIDTRLSSSERGAIDVSSLSSGMYMLILSIGDEQYSKKFVKD